jgi:hypothetical protein
VLKKICDHPALVSKAAADMVVRSAARQQRRKERQQAGGGRGKRRNSLDDFIAGSDEEEEEEGSGREESEDVEGGLLGLRLGLGVDAGACCPGAGSRSRALLAALLTAPAAATPCRQWQRG